MSAFTIPSIFTAVDKFSAPLRKMTANTQSFAQKTQVAISRLERSVRKLTPSFGSLGKQLLAFASVTMLISGVGNAINTIKDFEQANANLASVMGTTVEKNKALSLDAERLGSITAKSATEVVGLQESFARLGFSQQQIIDMTEATINGSIAMNSELSATAELTGAMVNSFDAFSSADAPQILDQMTLATQKSALSFEKLQTSLPIVSGAANAAGIPFDRLLALLGKLSDAGIDASSSSTALRNIFLDSAKKGHSYSQIIENIQNNQDKLTAANDEFGKRGAITAVILAKNMQATDELTASLKSAEKGQINEGVASTTAAKQLDTFQGSLTLLSSAYEGLLLKINKGSGALSIFRDIVEFVTKHIEGIAIAIGVAVGSLVALKTVLFVGKVAIFAYNVAVGIASVTSYELAVGVGTSTTAIMAQKIASYALIAAIWLWEAAQTALNYAMKNNIIGWIITGIVALVAAIMWVAENTEGWGETWDNVVGWMSNKIDMFASGFKLIWQNISNFFLSIAADLILSWKWAMNAIGQLSDEQYAKDKKQIENATSARLSAIKETEQALLKSAIIDMKGPEWAVKMKEDSATAPLVNPSAAQQEGINSKIEEIKTNNLNININDPGNNASVAPSQLPSGIQLSSTLGF